MIGNIWSLTKSRHPSKEISTMAKRPSNHYRAWTPGELKQLRALAKARTQTKVIARRLKRTLLAVYSKMKREAIVLAPALRRRAPRSMRVGR
jgi:hypothetical protein